MQKGIRFNGRPVWAEIRLSALAHNIKAIQRHINPGGIHSPSRPRRKILAVVKANAYGHGAVPVARALARSGVAGADPLASLYLGTGFCAANNF